MNEINYQQGASAPIYKRRWWMRVRRTVSVKTPEGWTASAELYVPFWAWPLELVHRWMFGTVKIA